MDKYVEQVIEKYKQRSETGIKKYGTTLERKDLNLLDWLNHLQEELMDASLYVERLKEEPKIELYMPKYTIGIEDTNEQEKPKQEWKPEEGEEIWIKVFSNWSKGTYIGYDVHKKVHLARESKEGGGNLLVSSNILPYSDMPNESKETLEEAAEKNYENKTAQIPVPTSHWVDSKRLQIQNFIEGAKSDAARDYWFEQFKK